MYNNMVLYFSSDAALFMQKRKNVEIQINLYTSCNEIVLGYTANFYILETIAEDMDNIYI